MNAQGLVGLDIDGTILLEDETISPEVASAVASAREAGYEVMLVTGRRWARTHHLVQELGISAQFAVCSDGAVIMRRIRDKWQPWHVELFDPAPVLALLDSKLREARYMVERASGQRLHTNVEDNWKVDAGRLVRLDELTRLPVSRIVVMSPVHSEPEFHRKVADAALDDTSYAIRWTVPLKITRQGFNKGTALARVCEELGIDGKEVTVVGDGQNDLEMFAWTLSEGGRAIAMGQAIDEVRNAAGETTDTAEAGGLSQVLYSLRR